MSNGVSRLQKKLLYSFPESGEARIIIDTHKLSPWARSLLQSESGREELMQIFLDTQHAHDNGGAGEDDDE